VPVPSPAAHGPIGEARAGVRIGEHHLHRAAQAGHRARFEPRRGGAVAELACGVVAPALDGGVAQERARPAVPGAEGLGRQPRDLGRRAAIAGDAELTHLVAAPAAHRTIAGERAAVRPADGDLGGSGDAGDGRRRVAEARARAAAELAAAVRPPAAHRAVAHARARVPSGRQLRHLGARPAIACAPAAGCGGRGGGAGGGAGAGDGLRRAGLRGAGRTARAHRSAAR
jgi:hypothetical protein